jgi:hypothetical protein
VKRTFGSAARENSQISVPGRRESGLSSWVYCEGSDTPAAVIIALKTSGSVKSGIGVGVGGVEAPQESKNRIAKSAYNANDTLLKNLIPVPPFFVR